MPNRRRRRHYSLEHKLKLIKLCNGSGASLSAVAQANDVNANLLRRWVRDFERGLLCATPAPAGFMAKPEAPACRPASLDSERQSDFIPVRFDTASGAAQTSNHAPLCGPLDLQVRRGDLVVQIQTKQSSLTECASLLAALFT
ncbi:MAG: transposase [Limnobacter sp.]|nr:transposase [Limnobacter sp.]